MNSTGLFGVIYLTVIFGIKLHKPHTTKAPNVGIIHGFIWASPGTAC